MYCVYKHTSPCGKVYIGMTGRNPLYRWNRGKGYEKQTHFFRAIQKYGWDNFKHEILFDGLTKEEACKKEIELIEKYKSNQGNFGYNLSSGGEFNIPYKKGQHFTNDHKRKIAAALTGIKRTEETKAKISESKKGTNTGKANSVAKKIAKCTKDGKIIKTYDCIREALIEMNLPLKRADISRCAKGKRKSAYGFCWKYVEVD